ncbi:PAS domain S-box protein [Rhodospirillales bacterium]|nr:PAS domain S-box protein [Rhodospirillales bacterium]
MPLSKTPLAAHFLEASPDPTLIKSADGTYLYINPAFERAFDVESENVIGRKALEMWGRYLYESANRTDTEVLETGVAMSYEISFVTPKGATKDLLVSKFPITKDDDVPLIGVTYADITNRKNIERELAESEERYALASHEVGIWDWNLVTGEVYISPAFQRLLGIDLGDKSKISSDEIRALYHPDDFAAHEEKLNEHLENRQRPYESVHRFRNADGSYRWYRAVGHATAPTEDKPRRVIGMLTDIDDEKRITEALRLSEARISTLLDNSPSSIYFKDANLRLVVANRKYLEMYNLDPDSSFGKTSVELFGEGQGQAFIQHDQEVLDKCALIAREETLDSHELLTIKFPIIDSDGTLAGVGGIEVDITERKEVERAFKDARDDAEAANRAKSTFLANMSHELRTPLNSVIGFSDSLLSGTLGDLDNELHREYIGIISSAGNYLLELINDILDLSRIESGHVELDESIFGVKSIITSAITFSQDRHAEKPLAIQNLTSETLPQVRADQRQIRQVMINLITNAIKFTPSGGEITISCDITPHGELEISVSDTGMGISPEDLERVTQPFVQVADSMTRQHEGTGLGLAIIRSIADLHDAEFKLQSTIGEGTKATFTLPADRVIT